MVTDEEKIRYLVIRRFSDVRDADARKAEAKKRAEKAKKANQANLEPTHRRRTYPRIADPLTDQIEVVVIEFKARKAEQRMEEAARKELATAYERKLNELASDELDSEFQAERRRSGAVRAWRQEDWRRETTDVAPQAGKSAQSTDTYGPCDAPGPDAQVLHAHWPGGVSGIQSPPPPRPEHSGSASRGVAGYLFP